MADVALTLLCPPIAIPSTPLALAAATPLRPIDNAPAAAALAPSPNAVALAAVTRLFCPSATEATELMSALAFCPSTVDPSASALLCRPIATEFTPVELAASPMATPKLEAVAPLPAPIAIENGP